MTGAYIGIGWCGVALVITACPRLTPRRSGAGVVACQTVPLDTASALSVLLVGPSGIGRCDLRLFAKASAPVVLLLCRISALHASQPQHTVQPFLWW